jgi:hypothetical protein
VSFSSATISIPAPIYLLLRHVLLPDDGIAADVVMGATGKVPIANGRRQRHCLSIEDQFPEHRAKWSDDFCAASTEAVVNCSCERNRDIKNSFLAVLRDELDELMRDVAFFSHP